jgi:hypothetical protein
MLSNFKKWVHESVAEPTNLLKFDDGQDFFDTQNKSYRSSFSSINTLTQSLLNNHNSNNDTSMSIEKSISNIYQSLMKSSNKENKLLLKGESEVDLSHLSSEERAKIEQVIQRAKEEEDHLEILEKKNNTINRYFI